MQRVFTFQCFICKVSLVRYLVLYMQCPTAGWYAGGFFPPTHLVRKNGETQHKALRAIMLLPYQAVAMAQRPPRRMSVQLRPHMHRMGSNLLFLSEY